MTIVMSSTDWAPLRLLKVPNMAFSDGVLWMPDYLTLELPDDNFLHTSIVWCATGWKVNVATVSADDRHVGYCYDM